MKTKLYLTLLITVCILGNTNAQISFNIYNVYQYDYTYGKPIKYSASYELAKVKSYEVTNKRDNGKLKSRSTFHLNASGYTTYSAMFNGKNKLKRETIITYTNDTQITSRLQRNHKGDTTSYTSYTFDKKNLVLSYSKQGKRIVENIYTYNSLGKTTSMVSKRNGKQKYAIKYEYNEDGKLIKQLTYNHKNELKRVTNYECNYQGESQKKVDQAKVCTTQDKLPNGGYVVYHDYTNPKGKLMRSVSTYSNDSNLVKRENFNSKNKLTFTIQYEYNKQGYCTKYSYQYHKEIYRSTFTLNELDLLVESTWGTTSGVKQKSVYTYNFYN